MHEQETHMDGSKFARKASQLLNKEIVEARNEKFGGASVQHRVLSIRRNPCSRHGLGTFHEQHACGEFANHNMQDRHRNPLTQMLRGQLKEYQVDGRETLGQSRTVDERFKTVRASLQSPSCCERPWI